jgi:hypothetical protein
MVATSTTYAAPVTTLFALAMVGLLTIMVFALFLNSRRRPARPRPPARHRSGRPPGGQARGGPR